MLSHLFYTYAYSDYLVYCGVCVWEGGGGEGEGGASFQCRGVLQFG